MKIVISSGHGLYIRGASGPAPWGLDEVDEVRKIVDDVAPRLRELGVEVVVYHDDVSVEQNENLHRIVDYHNNQGPHDIDCSVHLNAYEPTEGARGCEVLYVTQNSLAEDLAATMSEAAGFTNRGAKHRDDLFFLNQCLAPAVLLEVLFCDAMEDIDCYHANYDELIDAIATTLAGHDFDEDEPDENETDREDELEELELGGRVGEVTVHEVGKCSHFGGPEDMGVDSDEGLAFHYEVTPENEHLFLPEQPPGTTGLARRLDPSRFYFAIRFDYELTPKTMLADPTIRGLVKAQKTGRMAMAWPADWGPHEDTGRSADISPGLMEFLGITTDDIVEITYPAQVLVS
jgi:N-acetylmuramoyl-L-alanine amidase